MRFDPFFRRGQTATEYMIILAIVIIISLIVATILGQFPSLGGSTRDRGSSTYWQSTDVGFITFSIADDGAVDDIIMRLRNNRDHTISILDISFDGESVYNTSTVIAPGETYVLTLDDAGDFCPGPGVSYSLSVDVTYMDESTGNTYLIGSSGGHQMEGKCAS